jgi:hypothetical protein
MKLDNSVINKIDMLLEMTADQLNTNIKMMHIKDIHGSAPIQKNASKKVQDMQHAARRKAMDNVDNKIIYTKGGK